MTPEELLKLKLAYLEMRIGELDDLAEKINLLAAEVVKNHDWLSRLSNALADIRSDRSPRSATAERPARRR
jgi:hypothetical protein